MPGTPGSRIGGPLPLTAVGTSAGGQEHEAPPATATSATVAEARKLLRLGDREPGTGNREPATSSASLFNPSWRDTAERAARAGGQVFEALRCGSEVKRPPVGPQG